MHNRLEKRSPLLQQRKICFVPLRIDVQLTREQFCLKTSPATARLLRLSFLDHVDISAHGHRRRGLFFQRIKHLQAKRGFDSEMMDDNEPTTTGEGHVKPPFLI